MAKTPYNRICPVCNKEIWGAKNAHHVFNGAYKEKSEEDMFYMNLHPECHRELHDNPKIAKELKAKCQKWYEADMGSREDFIKRYGKSYL